MAGNNRDYSIFSYCFWMAPMKLIFIISIIIIAISNSIFANNLNSNKFFQIIENNDEEGLYSFFQKLDYVSLDEAKQFIKDVFLFVKMEGVDININNINKIVFNLLNNIEDEPQIKEEISVFLYNIFNDLDGKENKSFRSNAFFKKKNNKQKNSINENKENAPVGVIIGGIEVAAGILLLVTPWKAVGTGLVVDGVRRMLNKVEDIAEKRDEEIEKKHEEDNINMNQQPIY